MPHASASISVERAAACSGVGNAGGVVRGRSLAKIYGAQAEMEVHAQGGFQPSRAVSGDGKKIEYRRCRTSPTCIRDARSNGQHGRVVMPIKRIDGVRNVYDLARAFIEERCSSRSR